MLHVMKILFAQPWNHSSEPTVPSFKPENLPGEHYHIISAASVMNKNVLWLTPGGWSCWPRSGRGSCPWSEPRSRRRQLRRLPPERFGLPVLEEARGHRQRPTLKNRFEIFVHFFALVWTISCHSCFTKYSLRLLQIEPGRYQSNDGIDNCSL